MQPNKTFIIRHKVTKELWKANSGKTSWKAVGHAKNAWANSTGHYDYNQHSLDRGCEQLGVSKVFRYIRNEVNYYRMPLFDEQNTWELVELKSSDTELLNESIKHLEELYTRLGPDAGFEIVNFLMKVKQER